MTWYPDERTTAAANLAAVLGDGGFDSYAAFHAWSVEDRAGFWGDVVRRLGIVFATDPSSMLTGDDALHPGWMTGARLNIAESCFTAPGDALAVVHGRAGALRSVTYARLRDDVMRFAAGLDDLGLEPGDRVAIAMPMTYESVVAYLGTVWAGGTVVSIADSFTAVEIERRLRISDARLAVTQDRVVRGGRDLPMATKVIEADVDRAIIVHTGAGLPGRPRDLDWRDVAGDRLRPPTHTGPDHPTNILFSSGTTGDPKAIPWSQLTPIKAAMDGHYHHDIHPSDTVAWPTNLGWMMGPWLIYASLVNGATIALHDGTPTDRPFAEFVAEAGVTILGVVPSLVARWRTTGALEAVDWSGVRILSSTGEASNPSDMAWLAETAGGRPIIEYCGGTEIGGGYLTSTVLHPSVPSHFTTPALGLDIIMVDDSGAPADTGEVFLVPPSVGLSESLLNGDHDTVYYAGTPTAGGHPLRRHGDVVRRLPDGTYRVLGRADDTMNLGGIKVGSAELERAIVDTPGVVECAAVAVTDDQGGPSHLVVFAVVASAESPGAWADLFSARLRERLNPLFRVAEVVLVDALPRTASGKVVRRELRSRLDG